MYLITVEGGDGSGKGEAVRILGNIANRMAFPNVHITHEPRRHSELGKLALNAVSKGGYTPLEEAGLFAADRVDHSHTWIRPRLLKGDLVISDRNIHSSLVYQGVVGDLGLDQVAKMNAAAMIPDLVIWIDCDPKKAMKRISSGTLRMAGQKHEYFETTEIQTRIRAGFKGILSGEIETPPPFSRCTVMGPVLNESGLDDLEKQLIRLGKSKPEPSKEVQTNKQEEESDANFSTIGNEILTFLGATLLTLVGLFGVEVYIDGKDVLLFNTVPLLTSIWTVTAIVWSAFLFSRIGHINPGLGFPVFLRIQMSFGVGLAVFALATLNGSDSQTITDGWIWISILSTTALLGASLLATAWKFTQSLVSVKETVEVID